MNSIRALKIASRGFRSKYIEDLSIDIMRNIPAGYKNAVISVNVARWHADRLDEKMFQFARKNRLKDAKEILWTSAQGDAVVMTENYKVMVFNGIGFEEF